MKLLLLASGLESSTLEPAASWIHELTSCLAARGHRVTVLCTRSREPCDPEADPPGVTVWRPAEAECPAVLASLLEAPPDVVHVATSGPLSSELTALLAGSPVLVDLVDHSALCPAGDLMLRPHGQPCAQHYPVAPCGGCVGLVRVRAMEPYLALARAGHRVLAHMPHVRDRAAPLLGRGVALVPAGVDAVRFGPEPAAPIAPEIAALARDRSRPRVIVLGPPTLASGGESLVDLLVALHARAPGTELVVAGCDRECPDLVPIARAEARDLGIAEQLVWLPRVRPGDLAALLAACDVAVAPGAGSDPLGLPLMRALAVGLAVVAQPTAATRDLLLDGAAGVLASGATIGGFADAVARLLADATARTALGERARLAALERHDLDRVLVDTESLYERVRTRRRSRGAGPGERQREAA